jgi:hypothetical protein
MIPDNRPPYPYAWGGTENQRNLAPNRKPLAYLAGSGIAGCIGTVIAYQFPDMPPTVAVAWATILISLIGFALAYFIPPGEGE